MKRNSTFRTPAEKAAAKAARDRRKQNLQDSLTGRAETLPTHDGRGGTTEIPNGLHKERRRAKKKSVLPFNVLEWSPWSQVQPLLEEMFGEGCIALSEEQLDDDGNVIEKAGVVIPAECDSRAWAAIGVCYYGYRRKGVRWQQPSAAFAVAALRAWKLWIHVAGKNPSADISLNLTTLAGRVYSGGRNSVRADDILPILAGHCVRHVEACQKGKPEWGPNTFAWNDIFKSTEADKSKVRWGKARRSGEARSTIEYLEQLPPDLPMHDFTATASQQPKSSKRRVGEVNWTG